MAELCEGRFCSRCERHNTRHTGCQLRPVTNLTEDSWVNFREAEVDGVRTAFLCGGCLHPAEPTNQEWQALEFRGALWRATEASQDQARTKGLGSTGSGDLEPEPEREDESSDSDCPPTPWRRKSPAATGGTPHTPVTSEREAADR